MKKPGDIPLLSAIIAGGLLLTGCGINVPTVVGNKISLAEEKLQRVGLKSKASRQAGADAPSGEVISQNPKGGSSAKEGSVVSLVVAEGATLKGTFTLVDTGVSRTSGGCSGTGGYSDVHAGMQVVIKNEKNEILALGNVGEDTYNGPYPEVTCQFPIVVKDIPRAEFYQIEVGRRGSLQYSIEDLRKANWVVSFILGDN